MKACLVILNLDYGWESSEYESLRNMLATTQPILRLSRDAFLLHGQDAVSVQKRFQEFLTPNDSLCVFPVSDVSAFVDQPRAALLEKILNP